MRCSMILAAAAAALALAAPARAEPAPPTSPPVDPARLALATVTVEAVWPEGTYRRMMDQAMGQMMDQMVDSMFQMTPDQFLSGLPEAERRKALASVAAGKTMRDLMIEADPHFIERMRITNRTMWAEMGPVFTRLEPAMREGLARAYARRFDAAELADMNRFFATPSGRRYAAESLMLFVDPEVAQRMAAAMPELMKAMPAIMEKVQAATAHLPQPRARGAASNKASRRSGTR